MTLKIFPATDLHFLNTVSITLRFFASIGDDWRDLSAGAVFSVQPSPLPPFLTQSGLTLTATGTGSAVTRLIMQDQIINPGALPIGSVPVRLASHNELRRLFVPQSKLELEAGRTDRLLTVYGEFLAADGSLITADITAHPYLRYHVDVKNVDPINPGPVPNLSVNAAGRVNSGDNAGEVDIQISVDPALAQPAPMVSLPVTITPEVKDRPILKRFHTGAAIQKKSILFLPDGFTDDQQGYFEDIAGDVGRKLMKAISPYRHLRESFDLYSAFISSADEGVTIGPPILSLPNLAGIGFSVPLDMPVSDHALLLTDLLVRLGHPSAQNAPHLPPAESSQSPPAPAGWQGHHLVGLAA